MRSGRRNSLPTAVPGDPGFVRPGNSRKIESYLAVAIASVGGRDGPLTDRPPSQGIVLDGARDSAIRWHQRVNHCCMALFPGASLGIQKRGP